MQTRTKCLQMVSSWYTKHQEVSLSDAPGAESEYVSEPGFLFFSLDWKRERESERKRKSMKVAE